MGVFATATGRAATRAKPERIRATLLTLACAAILAGILAAGLWPFHAPRNQVDWLPDGAGIWFGSHGTLFSGGVFKPDDERGGTPCAIEIGLAPVSTWEHRTILAFYAANGTIPLSLHQSNRDLLIESQGRGADAERTATKLRVDNVFRRDRIAWVGITTDGHGTAVYVDGTPAAESQAFVFTVAGELIIANSPVENDSWSGRLTGLAVYHERLTYPLEVRHYGSWVERGRPDLARGERPLALYLFKQAGGRVVPNQAGGGPSLRIPERYTVFDQIFLERPWNEYAPNRQYLKDVLINLIGFVPFGFIFFAYFSLVRRSPRALLRTIFLGAAVSITIEIVQSFLPTRDSGMTDIITNTLGTASGAGLYGFTRHVLESGFSRSRSRHFRWIAAWLTNN